MRALHMLQNFLEFDWVFRARETVGGPACQDSGPPTVSCVNGVPPIPAPDWPLFVLLLPAAIAAVDHLWP
jgi:hypothetical protein